MNIHGWAILGLAILIPVLPQALLLLPFFRNSDPITLCSLDIHSLSVIVLILCILALFLGFVYIFATKKWGYVIGEIVIVFVMILNVGMLSYPITLVIAFVPALIPSLISIALGILSSFVLSCFKGEVFDYEKDAKLMTTLQLLN